MKIEAPAGKVFTQASAVNDEDRLYIKILYLSVLDNPNNWVLVDETEKY